MRRGLVAAYRHRWSYNFITQQRVRRPARLPESRGLSSFASRSRPAGKAGSPANDGNAYDSVCRVVRDCVLPKGLDSTFCAGHPDLGKTMKRRSLFLGGMKPSDFQLPQRRGRKRDHRRGRPNSIAQWIIFSRTPTLFCEEESLRVRLSGERPQISFSQVEPLLNSDDPEHLHVALAALIPQLIGDKAVIPRDIAKEAFLGRAVRVEGPHLVAFHGLDGDEFWRRNQYQRLLTDEEEAPLLQKWSQSAEPSVRRLVIERLRGLLGKPEKLDESTRQVLEQCREALLNDDNPDVRLCAAKVWYVYGKQEEKLKEWIVAQEDPLRRVRRLGVFSRENGRGFVTSCSEY